MAEGRESNKGGNKKDDKRAKGDVEEGNGTNQGRVDDQRRELEYGKGKI